MSLNLGLVLPDEVYDVSLADTLAIASQADTLGYHSIWKQEASWSDAAATLGAVARVTETAQIGTGCVNPYSRTPALLAMTAGTLDSLSGGRAQLGLGVSSPQLVSELHSQSFDRPLRRLRETIEIINQAHATGSVAYDGEIFDTGNYPLTVEMVRDSVPIHVAGMQSGMRSLTGEFADGWIPGFVPWSRLPDQVEEVRSAAEAAGRDRDAIDVRPWVLTSVAEDGDRAEALLRNHFAKELSVGYDEVVGRYGYEESATQVANLFRRGEREAAAEALPEDLLDEFTIYGTPEVVRNTLERYLEVDVDGVVVSTPFGADLNTLEAMVSHLAPLTD